MNQLIASNEFKEWIQKLSDMRGKRHILKRITNAQRGNLGHAKSVGDGIFETMAGELDNATL